MRPRTRARSRKSSGTRKYNREPRVDPAPYVRLCHCPSDWTRANEARGTGIPGVVVECCCGAPSGLARALQFRRRAAPAISTAGTGPGSQRATDRIGGSVAFRWHRWNGAGTRHRRCPGVSTTALDSRCSHCSPCFALLLCRNKFKSCTAPKCASAVGIMDRSEGRESTIPFQVGRAMGTA